MDEKLTKYLCQSPVIIIVFNRPEKVKLLLRVLREVKPHAVYVISDGPRDHNSTDQDKVRQVREIIDDLINWDCNVTKIYAEKNLSGPIRVPSGFDQVFKKEDRAIILEDDCIPSVSFFNFCDELLMKYRDDERVGTVCGFNLEFDVFGFPIENQHDSSYFFSRYPASWGWATWKRVWVKFDREMEDVPQLLEAGFLDTISSNEAVQRFWEKKFISFHNKSRNNWDYKLTYTLLKSRLLSIIPNKNLVSNVGTEGGANYKAKDYVSRKIANGLDFPLVHPKDVQFDSNYDQRVSSHFFSASYLSKLMRLARNIILRFF